MQMILTRRPDGFTDLSTIGDLCIDGTLDKKPFCNTLELSCRRANANGKLAIPSGRYKVIIGPTAIGNRFHPPLPYLPLLVGVPGRTGIRIHPGNGPTDLEGCIAVGLYDPAIPNFISDSRITFNKLFALLKATTEDIFITISGGL